MESIAIVSSSDGLQLSGLIDNKLYLSIDGGKTWKQSFFPAHQWINHQWIDISSSADGSKLALADGDYMKKCGNIYMYEKAGEKLVLIFSTPKYEYLRAIILSPDGSRIVVASFNKGIYYSSGDWKIWKASGTDRFWTSIAFSSSDGKKVVAATESDGIFISNDGGKNWDLTSAPKHFWFDVASSIDGNGIRLAAACREGIYVSSDGGQNWLPTSAGEKEWSSIASSADGSVLAAAVKERHDHDNDFSRIIIYDGIYTSSDFGKTWTKAVAQKDLSWISIASSYDGSKLIALSQSGGIHVN